MSNEQIRQDNVPAAEPDGWRIEDYCCGMPVWTKEPPAQKTRAPYKQEEEEYASH